MRSIKGCNKEDHNKHEIEDRNLSKKGVVSWLQQEDMTNTMNITARIKSCSKRTKMNMTNIETRIEGSK